METQGKSGNYFKSNILEHRVAQTYKYDNYTKIFLNMEGAESKYFISAPHKLIKKRWL